MINDENKTKEQLISELRKMREKFTDLKKEVDKKKEGFFFLMDASPYGISIIRNEGEFEYVNSKFTEIYGCKINDIKRVKSKLMDKHGSKDLIKDVLGHLLLCSPFADMEEITPETYRLTGKDGTEKVVILLAVKVRAGDKFIIHQDITLLSNMETQLVKSQKMEAIGTLYAGIAHKLNNIFTPLIVNAEMSLMSIDDREALNKYINNILKYSDRARDLVNQILTFSRQKSDEKKALQLHSVIKDVIQLLELSIPSIIEIQHDIASNGGVIIGDQAEISQMLMNLCTNAFNAMRTEGGKMEIGLSETFVNSDTNKYVTRLQPGPYFRMTVKDSGKFLAGREKDNGCSFSVANGIAEKMGGAMVIDAIPESGTTVHVFLPKAQTEAL